MSKKYYQNPLAKRFYDEGLSMSGWARKHNLPAYQVLQLANGTLRGTRGISKKVIEMLKADGLWVDDDKAA
jgi:gp16 family phage-associated protein